MRKRRKSWVAREGKVGLGALIFQDDVQRVDDTRNVTQDGEQDVDEEISTASSL